MAEAEFRLLTAPTVTVKPDWSKMSPGNWWRELEMEAGDAPS